jgi:AcrR family transcriptional regulator
VRRTLELVRSAAVVELAGTGWGGFTIEGVAARAGVARSTVYRHWPDRVALLRDAFEHHSTQPPPAPGGTPRERVVQIVIHLAAALADPATSEFTLAAAEAARREPALADLQRDFATRRRQVLVDAVRAAGTEPADLAAEALAGAVLYRRLLTDRPVTPDEVPALVALVLR